MGTSVLLFFTHKIQTKKLSFSFIKLPVKKLAQFRIIKVDLDQLMINFPKLILFQKSFCDNTETWGHLITWCNLGSTKTTTKTKNPGGRDKRELNSSSSPHSRACVFTLTQRSHSAVRGGEVAVLIYWPKDRAIF